MSTLEIAAPKLMPDSGGKESRVTVVAVAAVVESIVEDVKSWRALLPNMNVSADLSSSE